MPVFKENELDGGGFVQQAPRPRDAARALEIDRPSLGETVGAAIRQNNASVSFFDFMQFTTDVESAEPEAGYDPYDPAEIAGYEDRASAFTAVRSRAEAQRVKQRIDEERADREVLGRSGALGVVASIGAGIVDPVNLVPVGGWGVKAKTGGTLLGTMAEGVVVGAQGAALSEGVLYATQQERTLSETGYNVLGGALFGGLLGAGGYLLTSSGGTRTPKLPAERPGDALRVADDITNRLIAAGRPEEEAKAAGALYGSKYSATARRFGTDAWTEYQRSGVDVRSAPDEPPFGNPEPGLAVSRGAPDVVSMSDPEVERLLGRIRSERDGPTAARETPSLLEMISGEGGVVDRGGELSKMDAESWHRGKAFRRRLLREDTADEVALANAPERWAERAWERGYITEPTEEALYEAVRRELAGKPVRPFNDTPRADPEGDAAVALQETLAELGLDATDDPATIRRALARKREDDDLLLALEDWERQFAPSMKAAQIAQDAPLAARAEAVEPDAVATLEAAPEPPTPPRAAEEAAAPETAAPETVAQQPVAAGSPPAKTPPAPLYRSDLPPFIEPGVMIELPNTKKGWLGGPLAAIGSREQADGRFAWRMQYDTMKLGTGFPWSKETFATREEALAAATAAIRRYVDRADGSDPVFAKIKAWLDDMVAPKAADLFDTPGAKGSPSADAAPSGPPRPATEPSAEPGGAAASGEGAGGGAGASLDLAFHIDENHARLYALGVHAREKTLDAAAISREAEDLARVMGPYMDFDDVGLTAKEKASLRKGEPITAERMIEAATAYVEDADLWRATPEWGASKLSYYDADKAAEAIRAARGSMTTYPEPRAAYAQIGKGMIELTGRRAVISLFEGADASTFVHETGHLWLSDLIRDSARANAPAGVKTDLKTVLDWLGVDDPAKITRDHHERFAQAFERYLADGKAPSKGLARAFEQFKSWLGEIYRDLNALGAPISLEVRSVFDRMLTVEERIDAEFARAGAADWIDDGSLSAASATPAAAYKPASAFGLEKMEAVNPIADNPLLRALTSPNRQTARIAAHLAEAPYFLEGNARGVATPLAAETRIKGWRAPLASALDEMDAAFIRHRLGREKRPFDMARTGFEDLTGQNKRLSYKEFKEAVGKAMRQADEHPIPEVKAAATAFRQRVFDPLKEEAIKLGLLPPDVEVSTALSYLTRVYNLEKIANERNAFVERLVDWFEASYVRAPTDEVIPSRGELRAEAEEVVAKLLGSAPGRTSYDVLANLRGPLKERTLNVPDTVIEDFLESDVERVARIYTRTMSADVEIARAFGRPDMRDQIDLIRASYDRLFRRQPDGKAQAALQRRLERDVDDIEAMRDRIRGTYGTPDQPMGLAVRAGRTIRTLNYLRLLGGMTLSAIPDVARPVMVHGFGRVFGRGLRPMIADARRFKLSAGEAKLAGTALDLALDTRAQQMADVFEDYGRYSKFERGLQYAGEKFGKISLMSHWNAAMKQFVGVITQTRTLQAVEEIARGGGKPGEIRRLRMLGIDDDMSRRIADEFRAHGERGSAWWANTDAWTDRQAAAVYRGALAKEVDLAIVTPGEEKPLWMSTELGKTIGQFKSFTFSSMSRTSINALQQRDAAALEGLALSVALGMLSYYLKAQVSGHEVSDNPGKWLIEGIDNSGAVGWAMEANNMLEKVTAGRIGVNAAIGEAPSARYASRGVIDAIFGPTIGAITDTAQIAGATAQAVLPGEEGETKPLTRGDLHRMRRLAPFQNVFYLNWLFDRVEEGTADALGLPEVEQRGR